MKNQNLNFKLLKTLAVFILLFFTFIDSYSQYQIRRYNMSCGTSPGHDYGRAIINRLDNGYAISGYSYHSPACGGLGNFDWMFIKLKPTGLISCVKLLGLQKDDKCYSLIQAIPDPGYVLAGYITNNVSPFNKRAAWVRIDTSCNLDGSARGFTDTLNGNYYQIIRDSTLHWALTGYHQHITMGLKRNRILVSRYGAITPNPVSWKNKYVPIPFGSSTEEAFSICFQEVSGTYGIAVKTNIRSKISGVDDIMLLKLDALTGAVIFSYVYKFVFPAGTFWPDTEPRKIIAMPDGGFVIVGFTNAYGQTQRDIIVLRVSATGAVTWSTTYGASGLYEQGESIALDGSNLVITGSERVNSPPGTPNAFIMKIPETGGAPLWTRVWDDDNGTDIGYDIVKSTIGATGGYAVTGQTFRGAYDAYLWRANSSGLVPGGTCNDSIITPYRSNLHDIDTVTLSNVPLIETTVNCTEVTPTPKDSALCLASADFQNENSKVEEGDVREYSLKQNSPNPFNPVTTINYDLPVSGFTSMKVYDVSGRLVSTLINEFKQPGRHQVTFDGSNLSSGVYYYKIETEGYIDLKKMILIK